VKTFQDDLHNELGTWAFGYAPYGGADAGEVEAIAATVGDGDDAAFYQAWVDFGDRVAGEAEDSLAKNHRKSAAALYLRAACFYGCSYRILFGEPVDPRLLNAYRKQVAAFEKGLSLGDGSGRPVRIPFEGTTMPGYFIPARGYEDVLRPLVIFNDGYDATVVDMYFASAVAASQRGYHCLLFDGPGEGEMLFEQGIRLRPNWETVVTPVVDFALTLPNVNPTRIALSGWSLGGYLAPRGASGESRLAACIADPGLPGMPSAFRGFAARLGATPEMVADLGNLDDAFLERMSTAIEADRSLRWSIERRGFWVHGAKDLREYLGMIESYTMDGRAELIACPTLITRAENDPLSAGAQSFYDALRCPKQLLTFNAAEGAGMHCEMQNRTLLNRRAFDWLDEILN
jgi:alpha-beta hydrolase superfamily lysophospholipase